MKNREYDSKEYVWTKCKARKKGRHDAKSHYGDMADASINRFVFNYQ